MQLREYKIDRDSETWREIECWIKERLQIRRTTLEVTGLPVDETENARGAIEELHELENLVKPEVVLVSEHSEPDL